MKNFVKYTSIALLLSIPLFTIAQTFEQNSQTKNNSELLNNDNGLSIGLGAENVMQYLPQLKGKKVGLVSNQTGIVRKILRKNASDYTLDKIYQLFKATDGTHIELKVERGTETLKIGFYLEDPIPYQENQN